MITNPEFESINKIFNDRFNPLQQKANYIQSNIEWSDWTEKAINHFGTTEKPHEAGYILYDGQMLDFSGGYKDERRIDHSEIYQIYTDEELEEANKKYRYGGIIQLFQIYSNAIRISVDRYGGYIYLSIHDTNIITPAQIETLKYIENYDTERHTLFDVYDKDGNSIKSGEVSSVSELLNKINNYVEDSSKNKFNPLRGW